MKKIIFWSLVMFGLTYSCANTCNAMEYPEPFTDIMNSILDSQGSEEVAIKISGSPSHLCMLSYSPRLKSYFVHFNTFLTFAPQAPEGGCVYIVDTCN